MTENYLLPLGPNHRPARPLAAILPLPPPAPTLVAKSPLMLEVSREISILAPSHQTLLIQGETGTGKGLVARLIHNLC